MSSSPIDLAAARPAPRASAAATTAQAEQRGWLRRFLPRSLFVRSLLISLTPLVVVQAVATWFFYDRLVDTMMRRLSASVAGEITLVIETRHLLPRKSDHALFFAFAKTATGLCSAFP